MDTNDCRQKDQAHIAFDSFDL
ncbi:MAG: hypothetical protein H6Q54_1529, partial [Deltaproteobacteria bacterium]|nr:hypothetical protein [Deltaproteobacteria bacterium]